MNPEDDINLPTIQVPKLPDVTQNLADTEINKLDLQFANLKIQLCYNMLPQVKTINGFCRMLDASIKAVKHRRDVLCLPYGHQGSASRKDVEFPGIDD